MLNKQVTGWDTLRLTSPWQLLTFSLPPTNSATFVIKNYPCEKLKRIMDVPKASFWKAGWPAAGAKPAILLYITNATLSLLRSSNVCWDSQPGSPHAAIWGHYFIYPPGSLQPCLPHTTSFSHKQKHQRPCHRPWPLVKIKLLSMERKNKIYL